MGSPARLHESRVAGAQPYALDRKLETIGGHLGGLAGGALAALVIYELPDKVRGLPRQAPTLLAAGLGLIAFAAGIAVA